MPRKTRSLSVLSRWPTLPFKFWFTSQQSYDNLQPSELFTLEQRKHRKTERVINERRLQRQIKSKNCVNNRRSREWISSDEILGRMVYWSKAKYLWKTTYMFIFFPLFTVLWFMKRNASYLQIFRTISSTHVRLPHVRNSVVTCRVTWSNGVTTFRAHACASCEASRAGGVEKANGCADFKTAFAKFRMQCEIFQVTDFRIRLFKQFAVFIDCLRPDFRFSLW